MVPIFFFLFVCFSALTKYKMNSNIENDYDQCFIGNHLKEECHKKSFSRKTGMVLLQDVSEKARALLEWRCEVKISESDLNKEFAIIARKSI